MGKVMRDLIEYNGISMYSYKDIPYFRQMNVEYTFAIPDEKIEVDQIFKVWVDAHITETQLVKTPVGKSLEGQVVTGYKVLVTGVINLKLEYVACNNSGSVHTTQTEYPFCGYVVLPGDISPNVPISTCVSIEDILINQLDCRFIYSNVTMMIIADIC